MNKKYIIKSFMILFLFLFISSTRIEATEGIKPIKVPVLMYHHISDEVNNSMVVSKDKFYEDMITLKEAGYEGIFLTDLYEYLQGNTTLPDKPIIITFDDGYSSFYEIAYPIAQETNMKLTVSIIGWSVGRDKMVDNKTPIIPHFSWIEAKEMLDSGLIDIQNHTYDLHSPEGYSLGLNNPTAKGMMKLNGENNYRYRIRLRDDLITLNYLTYNNTGHIPSFIAYPYGMYSDLTESAIYSFGFKGSLTSDEGIREFKTVNDLKKIPRINITNFIKKEELLRTIENSTLK